MPNDTLVRSCDGQVMANTHRVAPSRRGVSTDLRLGDVVPRGVWPAASVVERIASNLARCCGWR